MTESMFAKGVASELAKPNELIVSLWRIRYLRAMCKRLLSRLEGSPMVSQTQRTILKRYYDVEVGHHSYGGILEPGLLPRGTRVGAWCSVGTGLIVRRRNHPVDRISQHPYFYNHALGFVEKDTIILDEENPLTIGHDVWIGDRVTILSGCKEIGNGAVLAAGSVVTKDVSPYAIVGGSPAKLLKRRFDATVIKHLERSQWWTLSAKTLGTQREALINSIDEEKAAKFADWAINAHLMP